MIRRDLDGAVGQVAHPPRHAEPFRLPQAGPPEADALDVAVHHEPAADHATSLRETVPARSVTPEELVLPAG